jgi:hypothetical protein
MNNEFVSYEIALKLKELGFDEPCFTYYYNINGNIRTGIVVNIYNAWTYLGTKKLGITLAPLYQQVFRWFREKKNLYGVYTMGDDWNNFYFHIWRNDTMTKTFVTSSNWVYETYEEAELACLDEMIKIIENK